MASGKFNIDEKIWSPLPAGASLLRRVFFETTRLVFAVVRDMREGHLTLRATSLVYTTLLSLAPVLAVSFSVLKGIGAHDQIKPFLARMLEPFGENATEITDKIVTFVDNINVGVLGIVGIGLLFYGVVSLMHKIEIALNDIWRVHYSRKMIYRVRDYFTILLIGPLFMFLSVGMTTALQHASYVEKWLGIDLLQGALEQVFSIVPYILFTLAFALIYMVMPNTRVRPIPALAAGFLAALMWKGLGWAFGIFVAGSGSYAAIYSVFASLILFMIWMYMGWLVVLIGASICYYLQNPSDLPLSRSAGHMGILLREKLALQIMADIARAFYARGKSYGIADLAMMTGIPATIVGDMVSDLVSARILAETSDAPSRFVPAVPLDTTSAYHVLQALRSAGDTGILTAARIKADPAVEAALAAAQEAEASVLGKVMIKDMAQ